MARCVTLGALHEMLEHFQNFTGFHKKSQNSFIPRNEARASFPRFYGISEEFPEFFQLAQNYFTGFSVISRNSQNFLKVNAAKSALFNRHLSRPSCVLDGSWVIPFFGQFYGISGNSQNFQNSLDFIKIQNSQKSSSFSRIIPE